MDEKTRVMLDSMTPEQRVFTEGLLRRLDFYTSQCSKAWKRLTAVQTQLNTLYRDHPELTP